MDSVLSEEEKEVIRIKSKGLNISSRKRVQMLELYLKRVERSN